MAERAYDVESFAHPHIGTGISSMLTADIDGQTLVVESMFIYPSTTAIWKIMRYVNTVKVNEWRTPTVTINVGRTIRGPWVLIGSAAAPQELRLQPVTTNPVAEVILEFSRE